MTKSSPRRAVAAAIAAVLSLASCSTFTSSSSAFSVDGENYPKDDLNGLVKNLIAVNQLTAPGGLAASKDLASIVSVMVQYKAGGHVLKEYGGSISEAARSAATAQLNQSSPQGLDDQTKTLFVDIAVTGQAIDTLPVPADIEARYEANPVRTGVVCIAETTVRTESEAHDVLDRIAAGEPFAKVAAATTVNKDRKASQGNVLDGGGAPCSTLDATNNRLSPAVMRALAVTTPGKPTVAVQDSEGWHVAINRPWKDIAQAHATVLGAKPGRLLLTGYLATADIHVSSTYGTWNPVTARVE